MGSAGLGIAFVCIGFAAMFLMFHLWGYPFDKATRTSSAPKVWMLVHRVLGYAFIAIYIVMMVRMVPRLWRYQVEFPARTAIHIVVAFTVGFLLLIKVAIARFFRHFEEWMPFLGVGIMLGTVIVTGLSLPFLFQARDSANEVDAARVARLLPAAGLPAEAPLAELSTPAALGRGRDILLEKCANCHDLRTILAKPRSPSGWWEIVERMADKPALFAPLDDREMWEVTGYLVAITPDLQRAAKRKREDVVARDAVRTAVPGTSDAAVDLERARAVYTETCSQCHDLTDVDAKPPRTEVEVRTLIKRMVEENEATFTPEQIQMSAAYMMAHFLGGR